MTFKINEGMGEEIITNMDKILCRENMKLICARYERGPGAIQACYVNNQRTLYYLCWYKLKEGIKDPRKDTAHLVIIDEAKATPEEFTNFIKHPSTPNFIYSEATA